MIIATGRPGGRGEGLGLVRRHDLVVGALQQQDRRGQLINVVDR
jgi:hypothetical protein